MQSLSKAMKANSSAVEVGKPNAAKKQKTERVKVDGTQATDAKKANASKGSLPLAPSSQDPRTLDPLHQEDIMSSVQALPSPVPANEEPSLPGAYATGGRPVCAPNAASTTTPHLPSAGVAAIPSCEHNHQDGLVEARAVEDGNDTEHAPDLEEARPMKPKPTSNPSACHRSPGLCLIALAAVILLGCCITVVLLVASDSSTSSSSLSQSPTKPPTVVLEEETDPYLWKLLPQVTRDAINQTKGSDTTPQALAYEWLLKDPLLGDYSSDEQRLLQRFVLATIFYATGGPTEWLRTDHWLSYEEHECEWYHSPECFHYCVCPDIFHPCDNGDNKTYTQMSIVANHLQGTLPPETFLLPSLREFTVMGNRRLEGTLPTELMEHATGLEVIHVSGNSLTGIIPALDLKQMKNLTHLRLCCNEFSGSIPSELSLFDQQMLELVLDSNDLTGSIPTELGLLTQLTDLRVHTNHLIGSLPSQVGLCTDLTRLRLSELKTIHGPIPTEYGQLTNLKEYTMEGSHVTGTLPTEIGLWEKMEKLRIQNSPNITGTIPSQLGHCTNLKLLALANNQLSGSIPTLFGLFPNMTALSLHENLLLGPVPSQLGQIPNMTDLNLYHNQLTGAIPSEMGLWGLMETLQLQQNQLSGSIPSELGLIANTTIDFNVSHNSLLVGTIPEPMCGINYTSFDCGEYLCGCDCRCSI